MNKKYDHLLETLLKDIKDEKLFIKERDIKALNEKIERIKNKGVCDETI